MRKIFFWFLGLFLVWGLLVGGGGDCRATLAMTEGVAEEASEGGEEGDASLDPSLRSPEVPGSNDRMTTEGESEENITEPGDEEVQGRLESVLEGQTIGGSVFDSLKYLVRLAVARGVPASTVVLILIVPILATMIAILHYWVGVTGFGTFMPTMVAITFVATGVAGGLALFAMILLFWLVAT